jgi:ABC-type multidrug transport system fused ATPase/permease subunit
MDLLFKIIRLLNRREKIQGIIVIGLFFVTSLLEVAGLGFIFLYVKLILDPAQLQTIPPLLWLYDWSGLKTTYIMVFLGGGLMILLAVKTLMALLCAWASFRFSLARMAGFSADLFRIYLAKDYRYFLNQNSSALKQNLLDEVQNTTFNVFIPILYILSEVLALTAIVLLLVLLHPIETGIMFAFTGVFFGAYLLLVKKRLDRLGKQRNIANSERFRLVNDAFSSIKETIIWDAKWSFLSKFRVALQRYGYAVAWNHIMLQVPRYLVEALGFCLIIGLMMYHLLHTNNPAEMISLIALYGAAGMRMMPSFNRIAVNAAQIRFHKHSLDSFYDDLKMRRIIPYNPNEKRAVETPLLFEKAITYDNVSFAFSEGDDSVIDTLSLTIHKRSSVALVGASGAGKSTMVDLLLGLIYPTDGEIRIDDETLSPLNIGAWRQLIGYIPQRIVLLDDSVIANVAFGIGPEEIDIAQVKWACNVARIDTFIETELPQQYETRLGENGTRLSGGQAQRIAIARALYRKPQVLIMDEATAALDGITEREITETLEELAGKMTLIIIAHRLNTVKHCDMIYLLHKGKISDWGTYHALIERNDQFKKMAE